MHKNIDDHKRYQKAYQAIWYKKNKKQHIKNTTVLRKKYETKSRNFVNEYKTSRGCKCGENHVSCLDFHHRDPKQKKFEIARGITIGYSIENLLKEIIKCDVLCSNCHKKLHWEERESRKRKPS